MQRFVATATAGLGAARHIAWYLSYRINGSADRD